MTLCTNSELREKYTWNPSRSEYDAAVKNLDGLKALKRKMIDQFLNSLDECPLSDSENEHYGEAFQDLVGDIFFDGMHEAEVAVRELETLWED